MFMKRLPQQEILLGVEGEEEDALQAWQRGGEPGYLKVEREGRWLHCSWSRARWVHLAPWPDGKEAVPRDLITGGETLRCELPNYESPGHTCSLEAHQCCRYWKIILAANLSSDEFHQGYKCRKRSLGFLKKKQTNHKTPPQQLQNPSGIIISSQIFMPVLQVWQWMHMRRIF